MKLIRPITVADGGAFSRASAATYFDRTGVLKSAPADTPRLSYDPADLAKPPAYLIEDAAQNRVRYSEQFSGTSSIWVTANAPVITDNAAPAPDGTNSACRFNPNGANGLIYQAFTVSPGEVVVFSTHRKLETLSAAHHRMAAFDNTNAAFIAQDIVPMVDAILPNGWARVYFVVVVPPGCTELRVYPFRYGAGAVSGDILFWGHQGEVTGKPVGEARPTSYIRTTAAAASRAADVNTLGLLSNVPEPDTGDPPAWSATSLVTAGSVLRTSSHEVFKALLGGPTATVTFTASNAAASVNWTNHGLANGTPVAFVNAGGALPAALTAGTTYYVVSTAANTFGLATTAGGAALTLATVGTGVHTAQSTPNYGKSPTLPANAAYWVKVGPTNRWAMFDQLSNTVTTEADLLATIVDVSERIDTVALLNVNAASARVIVTDAAAGVVYDEVHSLVSTDGVDNAWDWCFSPIERVADLTIEDLPPYYSPTVQVILSAPGETPSCGMCLLGLSYLIGGTQYGAQVGIQDYSVKSTDDFGNIEITPRQYAKRGTFSARFPKTRTDSVVKRLTEFRTTPALWLGSGEYRSTAIFGFYKDFSVLIDQLSHSLCEIEIEGLT